MTTTRRTATTHHTTTTDELAARIRDTYRRARAYAAGECADAAPRVRAIAAGMRDAWQLVTGADGDPDWSDELDAAAARHDLARWEGLTGRVRTRWELPTGEVATVEPYGDAYMVVWWGSREDYTADQVDTGDWSDRATSSAVVDTYADAVAELGPDAVRWQS